MLEQGKKLRLELSSKAIKWILIVAGLATIVILGTILEYYLSPYLYHLLYPNDPVIP